MTIKYSKLKILLDSGNFKNGKKIVNTLTFDNLYPNTDIETLKEFSQMVLNITNSVALENVLIESCKVLSKEPPITDEEIPTEPPLVDIKITINGDSQLITDNGDIILFSYQQI